MQELSSAGGERLSKGEAHFLRYGLSGARGEAESGFLTVRTQAMPVFTRMMEETGDSNLALLQTLLHLMAWNDDTNLVSRGGLAGLNFVQQEAQRLLWQGGVLVDGGLEALRQFDDELIARHLSPGGSADLLAVTWFLSAFPAAVRFSRCNPLQYRLRPHCTGESAIISLPGCHQVNTELRHNRIVFTDIVRRLS